MTGHRDTAIDIAKGIGIMLMILGHCAAIDYMPYRHFIFTFHMPLFFILSGYVFKSKSVAVLLKNDLKRLMVPYFITGVAVIVLVYICSILGKHISHDWKYYLASIFWGSGSDHSCRYLAEVPNIGAVWFLPALLVCKNVYNLLSGYSAYSRLSCSAVIFVVATLIGKYVVFIPFSILSGLSAMVFFAIGDYCKVVKSSPKWILLLFGTMCWILSFLYSKVYLVQPLCDLYFVDVIGASTATMFVYKLSKCIERSDRCKRFFLWIGRNTIYILCFHLIDLNVDISSSILKGPHPKLIVIPMLVIPFVCTWIFAKFSWKKVRQGKLCKSLW